MSLQTQDLDTHALDCLREAGRIAARARDHGAGWIVPGASLREVCERVENEIRLRGAQPAFPAQTSLNAVAAHYCPAPEETTCYTRGDLAKLDVGVHVDGWVVDTALTVSVGEDPNGERLIRATRAALEAAIACLRPGLVIREVSSRIEQTLQAHGVRALQGLCGHGVARWTVHCAPPIPNRAAEAHERLPSTGVVAIEPFATDGLGFIREQGTAEVFRLLRDEDVVDVDRDVLQIIRGFHGLPFARRQIDAQAERIERTLAALAAAEALASYPPLVERDGRCVAQAEHTVYVGEKIEVLTR